MPMNDGKYVAPTWVNGGPPALDASELQAICDAIVNGEAKGETLETTIAGKAQLYIGSYRGTGTYGSGNPTTVSFPFAAKFFKMFAYNTTGNAYMGQMYYNNNGAIPMSFLTASYVEGKAPHGGSGASYIGFAKRASNNKSISWYNTRDADSQLNRSDYTYYYLAIG